MFVSLVTNIAPLLVALFSYILYKIALERLDIINLFVSFAGVFLLITGSPDDPAADPSHSAALSFNELIVPSILLLTIPINQCSIQLFLRNMRNLSEYTTTGWLIITMLVIFLPMSYLTQDPSQTGLFSFMEPFTSVDWALGVAFGVTGVFSQTSRAKAVQYEEPAKLTVLNYFQSVIQLVMDVAALGTAFTGQQIVGVAVILGANSIKWLQTIKK